MEEFFKRMLEAFRHSVRENPPQDDAEAMERIVDLVFAEEAASGCSMEQLDTMIRRLFYRTRCRLGILQPLMEDPSVTEIMVNGYRHILVLSNRH